MTDEHREPVYVTVTRADGTVEGGLGVATVWVDDDTGATVWFLDEGVELEDGDSVQLGFAPSADPRA